MCQPKVQAQRSKVLQASSKHQSQGELQNLYVSNLPKTLDELTVRRVFARFGKISSIKLVSFSHFATNVAYVGYFLHIHAARALKFAIMEPELIVKNSNFEDSTTPIKVVKHRIRHEGFEVNRFTESERQQSDVQVVWLTSKQQRE